MPDFEQTPIVSDYKGNPILTLNPNDRNTFGFGVSKAKMILTHFARIKEFVGDADPQFLAEWEAEQELEDVDDPEE